MLELTDERIIRASQLWERTFKDWVRTEFATKEVKEKVFESCMVGEPLAGQRNLYGVYSGPDMFDRMSLQLSTTLLGEFDSVQVNIRIEIVPGIRLYIAPTKGVKRRWTYKLYRRIQKLWARVRFYAGVYRIY